MKKYIYILSLFMISLSACKKEEPVGGTAVQELSGEWWVQVKIGGQFSPSYGEDYYKVITYNTSDNSATQMWLDVSSIWANPNNNEKVFAKVNTNVADLSFSADKAKNAGPYYDPTMTFNVTKGKVTKNTYVGAVSKAVSDGISFEIEFSDDPGTIYQLSGYHRTKFPEDDH
ncbi:lipid-binding protein [Pedobacter gandavensis]|uniref:lipid-binding protein n=1 Tax=Pedobacter gandavensis TaxID=2679963 RepID=UPI00292FE874|nr:lipid-binding protein [Pedobacter gandavensis]